MGCCTSSNSGTRETLTTTLPIGKNRPLKRKPIKWTYNPKKNCPVVTHVGGGSINGQLTLSQLKRIRAEFWDTAPAFEGRKEIWDALKASAEAIETDNDYSLAQAILDGANITIPRGTLTECYDELGNRYKVPLYCLAPPTNLAPSPQHVSTGALQSSTSSTHTIAQVSRDISQIGNSSPLPNDFRHSNNYGDSLNSGINNPVSQAPIFNENQSPLNGNQNRHINTYNVTVNRDGPNTLAYIKSNIIHKHLVQPIVSALRRNKLWPQQHISSSLLMSTTTNDHINNINQTLVPNTTNGIVNRIRNPHHCEDSQNIESPPVGTVNKTIPRTQQNSLNANNQSVITSENRVINNHNNNVQSSIFGSTVSQLFSSGNGSGPLSKRVKCITTRHGIILHANARRDEITKSKSQKHNPTIYAINEYTNAAVSEDGTLQQTPIVQTKCISLKIRIGTSGQDVELNCKTTDTVLEAKRKLAKLILSTLITPSLRANGNGVVSHKSLMNNNNNADNPSNNKDKKAALYQTSNNNNYSRFKSRNQISCSFIDNVPALEEFLRKVGDQRTRDMLQQRYANMDKMEIDNKKDCSHTFSPPLKQHTCDNNLEKDLNNSPHKDKPNQGLPTTIESDIHLEKELNSTHLKDDEFLQVAEKKCVEIIEENDNNKKSISSVNHCSPTNQEQMGMPFNTSSSSLQVSKRTVNTLANVQKWLLAGKILNNKMTLEQVQIPKGFVIQVALCF